VEADLLVQNVVLVLLGFVSRSRDVIYNRVDLGIWVSLLYTLR
jgi:hypothetical protein